VGDSGIGVVVRSSYLDGRTWREGASTARSNLEIAGPIRLAVGRDVTIWVGTTGFFGTQPGLLGYRNGGLFAPDGVWEDGATGESPRRHRAEVLRLKGLHGPTPAHSTAIDVPIIAVLNVKDTRITRETIYYNPKLAYES
jgi:hypothetical protein